MTVLCESPSRTVRCSKYSGRTAGTGATASSAPAGAASAAQAAKTQRRLRACLRMHELRSYCWPVGVTLVVQLLDVQALLQV